MLSFYNDLVDKIPRLRKIYARTFSSSMQRKRNFLCLLLGDLVNSAILLPRRNQKRPTKRYKRPLISNFLRRFHHGLLSNEQSNDNRCIICTV